MRCWRTLRRQNPEPLLQASFSPPAPSFAEVGAGSQCLQVERQSCPAPPMFFVPTFQPGKGRELSGFFFPLRDGDWEASTGEFQGLHPFPEQVVQRLYYLSSANCSSFRQWDFYKNPVLSLPCHPCLHPHKPLSPNNFKIDLLNDASLK